MFDRKYVMFGTSLKICLCLKGMKHTLFTICTLFNLKKLKRFFVYNIILIISYKKLPINHLLLNYSSIRSLNICKHRHSNAF